MRLSPSASKTLAVLPCALSLALLAGCQGNAGVSNGTHRPTAATASGGSNATGTTGVSNAATSTTGNGATNGTGTTTGTNSTAGNGATNGTTGAQCVNLQCQVPSCPGGAKTTISGTIKDPAGNNPLYNVVAYVPNAQVQPLPSGASCASCSSQFSGDPIAVALSDTNGHFSIPNVPAGTGIPAGSGIEVVVQVGKWRTHHVVNNVNPCVDNPIGDIKLPSKMVPGDPVINLPDIAVSTGSADSLECLLTRIGIDSHEYVAGNNRGGKVHIFKGGASGSGHGTPEANQLSGSPGSSTDLWASPTQLMAHDIVLLSCEGDETYSAQPANLEAYLNNGGRVFASHYHYAWFAGPLSTSQGYAAPADWGNNLASWTPGSNGQSQTSGIIQTTLPNGQPFYKGQALNDWLNNTGALQGGQLPILQSRENAMVSPANTPSTPWIVDSTSNSTLYFSFDTPIGAPAPTDGGAQYCGRGVFSGLHVGGASLDTVNSGGGGSPPPAGCDTTQQLSPQEKALEFMLFDLSSCVVPDTVNPADAGGIKFN